MSYILGLKLMISSPSLFLL